MFLFNFALAEVLSSIAEVKRAKEMHKIAQDLYNDYMNGEIKMTREDARQKINAVFNRHNSPGAVFINADKCLELYEALGLLKFEEEKAEELFVTNEFNRKLGTIRLEHWPEGLVLWVGGEIVYRSWKP